jgi:hypothetical protein
LLTTRRDLIQSPLTILSDLSLSLSLSLSLAQDSWRPSSCARSKGTQGFSEFFYF